MGSASDVAAGEAIGLSSFGIPHRSQADMTHSDNQSTNTSATSTDGAFSPKYGTLANGSKISESSSEVRVKVKHEHNFIAI